MKERNTMGRCAMPPGQRAKQFMPFSALTGLETSLRRKERELLRVGKPQIPEEEAERINRELSELQKNDTIHVTFFRSGMINSVCGTVGETDLSSGFLEAAGTRIPIRDILHLEREK
ncbi:MAG: YolD-like family protein [Eubacterium sp.]|nr:YolD-like family protein [Eubacterium sp.]